MRGVLRTFDTADRRQVINQTAVRRAETYVRNGPVEVSRSDSLKEKGARPSHITLAAVAR
jgi:hypothetical protein